MARAQWREEAEQGRGATTAQAARETGLTVDGVNHHLRRLSERRDAATRTELVARAYALGLLTPGVWPPTAVPAP